jgi:hypothetical protein
LFASPFRFTFLVAACHQNDRHYLDLHDLLSNISNPFNRTDIRTHRQ